MAHLATTSIDQAAAAPAGAIDRGQLSRMTFGDRSLEREVLQLFDRQAGLLLARMHSADPAAVATLAHTLKGSATSIGASGVELAAAAVERTAGTAEGTIAIGRLATAIEAAGAEIAALLGAVEG